MGFAPASSVPSAGGGGGVVQQGARDATAQAWLVDGSAVPQPVTGPLTAAQLAALEPLGVTVGNFPASQPVTGPLTNAELRAAAVAVDASGVTVPVSVAALPLPSGAATDTTLGTIAATLVRVLAALNDVALTAILQREALEA